MKLMKTILIVSSDVIGKKMAGPGIRYWNMAIELSKRYKVILAVPNFDSIDLTDDFYKENNVIISSASRKSLKSLCNHIDTVVVQGNTLWKNQFLKRSGVKIVIDLYDPFVFEILEIFSGHAYINPIYKNALNILNDQLLSGDYFICASEKQRDFWIGALTALYRINSKNYENDKSLANLIGVVPFGLSDEEPIHNREVLKGVYKSIKKTDTLLIWGGGIWEWFDPITLIRAMGIISENKDDIKLFFMGTKHPNPDMESMKIVEETIKLSDELGLTDQYVFFNDWVDYEDRHNYLLEADIGISLHKKHIETRFSFRTRILDYLWTSLPVITNDGDFFSELIKQHEIGRVINDINPEKLAECIMNFPPKQEFNTNFSSVKQEYEWAKLFDGLIYFIDFGSKANKKQGRMIVMKNKITYIFHRIFLSLVKGDFSTVVKNIRKKVSK